jgi:hypothetical protein
LPSRPARRGPACHRGPTVGGGLPGGLVPIIGNCAQFGRPRVIWPARHYGVAGVRRTGFDDVRDRAVVRVCAHPDTGGQPPLAILIRNICDKCSASLADPGRDCRLRLDQLSRRLASRTSGCHLSTSPPRKYSRWARSWAWQNAESGLCAPPSPSQHGRQGLTYSTVAAPSSREVSQPSI